MSIIISGNTSISGNSLITHKLLLDDIPNMQFVFCDNLLRSAYTGASVRIRRLSDDKEEEFGFLRGITDWYAVNSFTSGGAAYISRRYNQGTYGGYVEQLMALSQPQLVIDSDNGLPCTLLNNNSCTMSVPDAPTIFTNDLFFVSAFRTKSFLTSNDFYSTLGYAETGYYRYISHYIGLSNQDKFILVANSAWPSDLIVVNSQHSVGPLTVITHSRSGNVMYARRNGSQIGSRSGVTGNLKLDSQAVYYYGENCHQHCYLQLLSNTFPTIQQQNKIEQFAINGYA